MTSDKWNALMSWFYASQRPELPAKVEEAIEAILEERQSADDDDAEKNRNMAESAVPTMAHPAKA